MRRIVFVIFLLLILTLLPSSYAHKLIPTDGSNNNINSALVIPDPIISWAMYEEINKNALYYKFDAVKGDTLFASIVIPKLDGLENFTPSLVVMTPSFSVDMITELKTLETRNSFPFEIPDNYDVIVFDYNENLPSKEFYEPFGQITYWERQEINLTIPVDGTYYLAVYDPEENYGKLALAVGYVEDFSASDFITVLPTAWIESRYFIEDFTPLIVSILLLLGISSLIVFLVHRKLRVCHKS